ncbi:hypothetical protein BDY21DRAFT_280493 [Lineolata rhizophorae]|uniref:FAD/NAD(P)-binding domain-containing protein n=1 Tax=Lineolata rhizophorae TaxID=578093 RepID=A0A6A6P8M6_9PEZI|nr:hypothetical protein BDY21DRAFT_280493 [Lineolata rhizophorae]
MSAVPNLPEELSHAGIPTGPAASVNGHSATKPATNGDHVGTNGAVKAPATTAAEADANYVYSLHDAPVENCRPIKVIVIGAGYSGIYCGIRLPERIRNLDLTIYDKNEGFGGTWWENRYPGCACDIPSHSYQYSFSPNTQWSALYAPSWEIRQYLNDTARKYSVDRFTKLKHEVNDTWFDKDQARWHLKITNLETGQAFEDDADVLISARGNLNNMAWPDIEGLDQFKGPKMHSAKWDQEYDFKGKRVGVIGTGSSAIQIIPALQKVEGTFLSCFARGRTWISPPFGKQILDQLGLTSYQIPPERRAQFARDPDGYEKFRLAIEEDANVIHGVTIRGHPLQKAGQELFRQMMKERLKSRPDIFEEIVPSFSPGCRRLTPGPGFLEALTEDNVDYIKTEIERIEPTGVRTQDGKLHEIDVLVCATGFQSSAPPPFGVRGLGGRTLVDKWADRADSYLSLATDGFPNLFMMMGPNSAIGSGSLTMMFEAVGDYIVKCVRKMQKENVRSMAIKKERVRDFMAYADAYFDRTVFMEDCRSWYRKGGKGDKVTGLWPGSSMHCIEALRSPRWEDYDYEYLDREHGGDDNRLGFLGNGWSVNQIDEVHTAWYLYPEFLQVPLAPRPEDNWFYQARAFSP